MRDFKMHYWRTVEGEGNEGCWAMKWESDRGDGSIIIASVGVAQEEPIEESRKPTYGSHFNISVQRPGEDVHDYVSADEHTEYVRFESLQDAMDDAEIRLLRHLQILQAMRMI